MSTSSLLPFTPDTMRAFRQEIMVDINALTKSAISSRIASKLPPLGENAQISFAEAFEALRQFRETTREGMETFSEAEKTYLAEIEVEWCLELLNRLPVGESE